MAGGPPAGGDEVMPINVTKHGRGVHAVDADTMPKVVAAVAVTAFTLVCAGWFVVGPTDECVKSKLLHRPMYMPCHSLLE